MPTITVKNIPPELYKKLKQHAETNHRSINSEIIACIEGAVSARRIQPDLLLATARSLRAKTAAYPISDSEFTCEKVIGRP